MEVIIIKRAFLIVLLAAATLLAGCIKNTQYDATVNVVKDFIVKANSNDWDSALKNLSGEALDSAQKNLQKNRKFTSSFDLERVERITAGQDFAVVRAVFSGDKASTNYYYLRRTEEGWVIFKVDDKDPGLPEKINPGPAPTECLSSVETAIKKSASGQWGNRTVNLSCQVQDIKTETLGTAKGLALVESSYTIKSNSTNPRNMKVLFTLRNNNGWKITGAQVVSIK